MGMIYKVKKMSEEYRCESENNLFGFLIIYLYMASAE
jgi:hypothetical protein